MKTTNFKKSIFAGLLTFLLFISLSAKADLPANILSDSTQYTAVRGTVINSETHQPVVFASVFIEGTHMGTVANSNGKFLIKIPLKYSNKRLGFSSIGYKTNFVSASELDKISNKIYLTPAIIPIKEVVIRHLDPVHLLETAVERIPENYADQPVMMTGFYR